jgi:hypothetical protein
MLEIECSDGIQYSNAEDAMMMQTHRPSRAGSNSEPTLNIIYFEIFEEQHKDDIQLYYCMVCIHIHVPGL